GNQEAAAWNPESKSRGARAAPDLVRTAQQAFPTSFHAAVWRRTRRTAIDRKRGSARGRAGNSGQAARQKTRNAVSAFRRRAGADRAGADLRGVSDQPGANLRAGRSGRAARRSQRGALLRPARRNDKIDRYAFRDHYAQSDHNGAHEPPLRRHDGRTRCLAACFGRFRSRRAVPRGELILLSRLDSWRCRLREQPRLPGEPGGTLGPQQLSEHTRLGFNRGFDGAGCGVTPSYHRAYTPRWQLFFPGEWNFPVVTAWFATSLCRGPRPDLCMTKVLAGSIHPGLR